MRDEFERTDKDAGVDLLPNPPSNSIVPTGHGVMDYREEMVAEYHGNGNHSLVDVMKKAGPDGTEALIMVLFEEVLKETDHLLGNQIIATQNGELRDASVISFKRAEVLEKARHALQSKQKIEQESGIDLDSPSMAVIFRYFMSKVKYVLGQIEMDDEQQDIFFQRLSEEMELWKKDLRDEFKLMNTR